jgi:hypothetical protein
VPPQKIGALLGAGELRALSRKARRLMELQQVFLDSAPSSLSRASRVQDYQTGTLFLSAENAAVATKLRQLAPSLLLKIRKREVEVTGIKIAVQVKEITETPQSTPEKGGLSAENLRVFRELLDSLPDSLPHSELKRALRNLIRRHEPRR